MDSVVWVERLREAASTASAIMRMDVSFDVGLGPGYVNSELSGELSG